MILEKIPKHKMGYSCQATLRASSVAAVIFFVTVFTLFIQESHGLYEDEAGKFDWRSQYVGRANHAAFDQTGQMGKRILVATEQNVLAAINARNGHLGWRHVFEKGSNGVIDQMAITTNHVVILHSERGLVRSFHPISGNLQWEFKCSKSAETELKLSPKRMKVFGDNDGQLAVLSGDFLIVLSIDTGNEIWSKELPSTNNVAYADLIHLNEAITVLGYVTNSHIEVLEFYENGVLETQTTIPAAWMTSFDMCSITGTSLLCLCTDTATLQSASLSSKQASFKTTLLQDLGVSGSTAHLMAPLPAAVKEDGEALFGLTLSEKHVMVLCVSDGQVRLFRDLPGVSVIQVIDYSGVSALVSLARIDGENGAFKAVDINTNEDISELTLLVHYPGHHGLPRSIQGVLYKRKDGQTGMRMLVVSDDHSLLHFQQSGKVSWGREEALSSILSVEMVDLPVSQIMAKMEDEFGSSNSDIVSMFMKRFSTQLQQLSTFLVQLQHRLTSSRHHHHQSQDHEVEFDTDEIEDEDDEDYLTRDDFGLHKMIVVTTAPGKIFGLDSTNGHVIWRRYLPEVGPLTPDTNPQMLLFVQRTTAHFPHHPQCSVLGRHIPTGRSILYTFHPISGVPQEGMPSVGHLLDIHVRQAMLVSTPDEEFLRPLLLLDADNNFSVYPTSASSLVADMASELFMFTTDQEAGVLQGYGIQSTLEQPLKAVPTWLLDLKKDSQTVTHVVGKRVEERVHSQGVVLGDRSVMYKYLNPNLVVVITEGEDATNKAFLQVYLVDAVSGQLVFHASHKRSNGPVNVVHSENWVIYSFWNQKQRRTELSVLELYEGKSQSNSTAFSSLHQAATQPIVMRQAYIFPGHITAMAATVTEMGITNKHVVFALESGGILELDRILLSARRPENPTAESREEGLFPYMPELPRPLDATINYNQSVYNIGHIQTSPAGLESTCLVLCYGLDLFYTRVTPSRLFDVLKDDFDYFFIGSVVLGMIVVSIVTQKLAARKALNKAWK